LLVIAAIPGFLNAAEPTRFTGTVKRGESFRHRVGEGLIFGLDPSNVSDPCQGWQIWIGPSERQKTYATIATAARRHGLIETDICGSDFRNSNNSGPNAPGPKNVNRPGEIRQFRFVANQRDYMALDRIESMTEVEASKVWRAHVRAGMLKITRLSLGNLRAGSRPTIERMVFTVELDPAPSETPGVRLH
jgi:hypothetical protein